MLLAVPGSPTSSSPRLPASVVIARSTSASSPKNLRGIAGLSLPQMNERTARGESFHPGGFGSLSAFASAFNSSAYCTSAGARRAAAFALATSQLRCTIRHVRHDARHANHSEARGCICKPRSRNSSPVMLSVDPQNVLDRLLDFQRTVRARLIESRTAVGGLHDVTRSSEADTIYRIDAEVDPILESFCEEWGTMTPLVLVAEGLEDENGREVPYRVYPQGTREAEAQIRVIVDPIDGTRGIM